MSDDLENRLTQALKPVAPREEFSARLLERVAAEARPQTATPKSRPRRTMPTWWLPAGLAASLLLAVGVRHHAAESQERLAGLAARQQVFAALALTNQKLDLAVRTVQSESRAAP
jgi:hypothetical protein